MTQQYQISEKESIPIDDLFDKSKMKEIIQKHINGSKIQESMDVLGITKEEEIETIETRIVKSDGSSITRTIHDGIETIMQFDFRENLVYCLREDGVEVWNEYNEQGVLMKTSNSGGYIKEYYEEKDENGNITLIKDCYGRTFQFKFDDNNRIIYEKYENGWERWFEYDPNGNLIYLKNSSGTEEHWEYDANNTLLSYTTSEITD